MDLLKKIDVELEGLADICFDRFIDHSKEPRPPEQKLYLAEGNRLVLPAANMRAFLFSEKYGCAKTFEGKKSKDYVRWGQGHVQIDPPLIDFLKKNKPIVFKDFKGGLWLLEESTVTKASGGAIIKQPIQPRPVLKLPWSLKFEISIVKNPLIDSIKLENWFNQGGLLIALGNYRPRFGRFLVKSWNEI